MLEDDGNIQVIVEGDADNNVRVTPTGTEIDLPDGSVIVQLGNQPQADDETDPAKFYDNLCDKLDGSLNTICEELMEQISADDNSRQEMLQIRAKQIKLLGLKLENPQAGSGDSAAGGDGTMSVVVNPLLLEACLKAWANAQAELLPSDGPCKVEDFDPSEPEANQELADDFERDMNFFLTEIATEYYPDTSHMLLWGNIFGGSGIKKIYRSPILRRPTSESVKVEDFIVSDTTKDLKTCERLTHVITMRPSVMKRMQANGAYREMPLAPPAPPEQTAVDQAIAASQGTSQPQTRPEDTPYTLWETQCELNLPQFAKGAFAAKNIPLPYLVTIEKDSRTILSIRRDWKPEDEDCKRRQMYVKYPYVPGPGFYGTGLAGILGNASAAMTAAWREALDAGMYANMPGGLIAELGARQNSNTFRPAPGEFPTIKTNGQKIGDIIMPMPYKDITPGLMTLIDKIIAQSKEAAGAVEIPVKEGVKDIPVGTMLAYIEQAGQVIAAAHKGMHRAQSEELTLIADLFREDPESFWTENKKFRNSWNEQRLFQALDVCTLVPRSDPNVPSHIHRLMKATALVQLAQMPQFAPLLNAGAILDRVLRVMREDPNGVRIQPPPPSGQPSPEEITAQAKLMTAQNQGQKNQIDALKAASDSEDRQKELAGEQQLEGTKLAQTIVAHQADNEKAKHQQTLETHKAGVDAIKTAHDMALGEHQAAIDQFNATKPEPEPKPVS